MMINHMKKFLGNIFSEPVDQSRDTKWLKDLQSEINVTKQEKVDITKESLKKILDRMPNWKSPGPDLVQGFWLKNFSSLHGRIRWQLKECLDSGFLPSSLTKGRTASLQKYKSKDNITSNYRPITRLEVMVRCNCRSDLWAFSSTEVFTRRRERCRKTSRWASDLLYIDRSVIREVKSRKKNLAMAWIDYKKTYDMVPHSCIKECLEFFWSSWGY